jgi:peptidoglycan/LPS O-acetylase OafA/YrhL
VVAPLLFCAWVAWLRIRNPTFAWLGKISYSIYLFHLVVMTPLALWVAAEAHAAWRGWPIAFYVIPTLLLTIAVSAAVFYAVELPAINMGKRLAGQRATNAGIQAAP